MDRLLDAKVLLGALESMNIGVIFADSDGVVRHFNAAAQVMKKTQKEIILGRKIHACHSEEVHNQVDKIISDFKERKIANWQKILVHDEPFQENLISPVFNDEGEYIGILMVILDVSGQRDLTEKLRKSERELTALFKASHTISSSLNLNDVLFKILLLVGEVINYSSGTIYLLDDEKEVIVPMATTDCLLGGNEPEIIDSAAADNVIAYSVRSGEIVSLERGKPGFSQAANRRETNMVLLLPLKDQDQSPMGVLVIESQDRNIAGLETQELLSTFANHAAVAIRNAQLFSKTKQMAIKDGLTNLYNRQYFDQLLEQAVNQARMKNSNLTVIMIDVNDLKFINDYFGHEMGDYIIKAAAAVLQRSIRDTDTVCRYGGDELVILLPNTSESETLIIHKRILQNVAKWNEEENKYPDIRLTLSIGCATAHGRDGLNDVLYRADQTMYEDKRRYKMGIHEGSPIEKAKKEFYATR